MRICREISIYVVIWYTDVNRIAIQFRIGKVCNFLELFDNLYAIITQLARRKIKQSCQLLTFIEPTSYNIPSSLVYVDAGSGV